MEMGETREEGGKEQGRKELHGSDNGERWGKTEACQ